MDKNWMNEPNRLSPIYREGIKSFIEVAKNHLTSDRKTRCPCKRCMNVYYHDLVTVDMHLFSNGMAPSYKVWVHHGEKYPILHRNHASDAHSPEEPEDIENEEDDDEAMYQMLNELRQGEGTSNTSMIQLRDQQTQASLDASGGEASQPVSEAEICSRVVGDRFLQTIGQRSRSRRSTSQRDRNVEGELRALRERDTQREQELLRMQAERERERAEREREKAETDRRLADIERMFGFPGGRPSVPQQGGWVPPQPGWVPPQGGYGGGMPPHGGYGGQPGGDPSSTGGGSTGGGYVMYPWGFPGGPDPSSGGWRWTGGGGGGGSGGGDGGGDGGGGSS